MNFGCSGVLEMSIMQSDMDANRAIGCIYDMFENGYQLEEVIEYVNNLDLYGYDYDRVIAVVEELYG